MYNGDKTLDLRYIKTLGNVYNGDKTLGNYQMYNGDKTLDLR